MVVGGWAHHPQYTVYAAGAAAATRQGAGGDCCVSKGIAVCVEQVGGQEREREIGCASFSLDPFFLGGGHAQSYFVCGGWGEVMHSHIHSSSLCTPLPPSPSHYPLDLFYTPPTPPSPPTPTAPWQQQNSWCVPATHKSGGLRGVLTLPRRVRSPPPTTRTCDMLGLGGCQRRWGGQKCSRRRPRAVGLRLS